MIRKDTRPRKTTRRVDATARTDKLRRGYAAIRGAKATLGFRGFRSHDYVKTRCERIYGASISPALWSYWLGRVLYEEDDRELVDGGIASYTEALLYSLAKLLSKATASANGQRVTTTRSQIARKATRIVQNMHPDVEIPDIATYDEVEDTIFLLTGRTYSDRQLRRFGLYRSQTTYSCLEIRQVLANIPQNLLQEPQLQPLTLIA